MIAPQTRLNGLRVLNTRPIEQAALLGQAICDAGGLCINLPALGIEPVEADWLAELPAFKNVQQAIFISANAVNCFFRKLEQHQVVWPSPIITTVIGKATASALSHWQIRVDNIPAKADSEHVLQLESLQVVQNQTILLVKGEGGRVAIEEELRLRGARLIVVDTYRRVLPETDQEVLASLWQDGAIDIILFTSQQAMHNLFYLFGEKAHAWLCSIPCIVISERLAKVASLLGMKTIIVTQYDALLSGLEQYANDFNSRSVPKLRIDP